MKIVFTSDTHGHVFPINYSTNKEENSGLFYIAAQIKDKVDGNTLLIDGGDSLQGTPLLSYYLSNRDSYDFNPMAEGFNAMGLQYYTLGNHDFNFGYDAILDYTKAMKAELICANVEDLRGELGIKKHAIHVLEDGTRVGITGAVTGYVNVWEQEKNLTELKITDPVEALKAELDIIRDKSDITVCIYHGGFEEDLNTGNKLSETEENQACKIARELDFDILLTGHQHMAVEGTMVNKSYGVQPPANGMKYCVLDIQKYNDAEDKKAAGNQAEGSLQMENPTAQMSESKNSTHKGWQVESKLIPVEKAGEAYDEILKAHSFMESMNLQLQTWLDEPIGCLESEIAPEDKLQAALYGSKVASIFNQVQLELTGADFSCTSLANDPLGLHKEITVRDVLGIYQFANTEEVKEVTGAVLRMALERCAEYFEIDENTNEVRISDVFLKPKVEHYNYDFYAGLWYEFDLTKPVGERVVTLKKLDGTDIIDDEKYTLVTSNYRATGTGGYECIGACRTIRTYPEEMPDLVIDFVRRNSPVGEIINNRFRCILPE
ncbi:bifunctional metallophosphatase/5'-nucleotidase [Butyrivibrio sp. WCE2006]|uniref:bifunctional metallophosphatase/5'-nucleotidase n=1 Tax=Butyrivibrio sp. WCE2006 TaxID=1410611 RepID=UPI0005D23B9C|nr:bifunctional UDP-sugar hydrolase/5'-nucleotidase [Butyrivibrio sp. WCE2006]